jgi:hypothetical protein
MKLSDNEKAKRAAARFKIKEQKYTRKQWASTLEPEFFRAIQAIHIYLGAGARLPWRANAPPYLLKAKPLIDQIYRAGLRAKRKA